MEKWGAKEWLGLIGFLGRFWVSFVHYAEGLLTYDLRIMVCLALCAWKKKVNR